MKRIGIAIGKPRGENNRQEEFGIHVSDSGATLYLKYEGYREGTVMTGLPMGGPGWRPPTYHPTTDIFALTEDNWAVVKFFDDREGGFGTI